jgi:LuxR family maltose regulon positive regulatory protein
VSLGPGPVQAGSAPVVPPSAVVPRTRLLDRLDAAADARVISLSAPGGYGKSTLVAQWTQRQPRRVIWLALPVGTDAVMLAERLAVELSGPAPAPSALPVVHDPALWFSVVLPSLERLVASQDEPIVLVLDDAMNLTDPAADALLTSLAAALPTDSQIVVASREETPQAIRRLRSTGRTLELAPDDLALDDDETRLLLDELGVHLPGGQMDRVVEVTEGWPIGVYLLGRAILTTPELVAETQPSAWAPSWMSDYIRDELFAALAEADAEFLMSVSVLDELSGPVCDAVSGSPGSLARLRTLAAHNQLIGHVRGDGESFRLHQMFSDFLRSELRARSTERFHAAHRAAAEWYADAGEVEAAAAHARQCADDRFLGMLLWEQVPLLLGAGKLRVVRGLIEGISDDRLEADCGLALTAAWVAAHEGDAERLAFFATLLAHRTLQQGDANRYRFDVDILEAFMGVDGLDGMVDRASRAIEGLPPSEPWLTVAYYLRGSAELLLGLEDEATADVAACRELSEQTQVPHLLAFAFGTEAQLALRRGDLTRAEKLADQASETLSTYQLQYMPSGAVIQIALAQVHLAVGRRDEARKETEHALRLTSLIGPSIPWFAVQGRLLLAQLWLQLGDPRQARVLLNEASDLFGDGLGSMVLASLLAETEGLLGVNGPGEGQSLSTAELRVLQYLPTYLSFPQIAEVLFLSRHTVKSQAISIYRKLGASSRGDAVELARERGLLPSL